MPRRTPSNTNTTTDDYSASTATTGVVVVGSSSTGSIESRGDHDWFAVTLEAGVTYQLRAGSASGSGRLSDTVLYLRDASGAFLTYNDDSSGTLDSLITYTATETGTYYLDVSGYGSRTGSYVVSATAVDSSTNTDDYTADTTTTGIVEVGSSSTGTIESGSDHDWFAVTLEAGVTYQLQAGSASGTDSLADTFLYLRDESGTLLTQNDDANISTLDSLITYTATETGTYYLDVAAYGRNETGDYVVSATAVETGTTDTDSTSDFNIDIVYSGNSAYQSYFEQAASLLESIITSDITDYAGVDDLVIAASVTRIDGEGNVLAEAGPTAIRSEAAGGLPYQGIMTFDSADISDLIDSGTFLDVVVHEMLHVLGFGTLWESLDLVNESGQYVGANAVAAYQTLTGDSSATYVPLETEGGSGTAYGHWDEDVFNTELMTGYAESSGNMPLSILTIAALEDLGYSVDYSAAEAYSLATSSSIVATGIQTTESFDGTTATLMAA